VLIQTALKNGLVVYDMKYVDTSGGGGDTSGLGILSGDSNGNLSPLDASAASTSGSQQISLYYVKPTKVSITDINTMENRINSSITHLQAAKQVRICVNSGTTKNSAIYSVGGGQQRLTVTLDLKNGLNAPC